MDIISIIGFAALAVGAIAYIFSRIPKQTIQNYKAYAESQEKRLKDLEDSDKEKTSKIATLEGRVEILQTIPLGDIAKAIKEIVNTQKEIIELIHTNTEAIITAKTNKEE